MRRVDEVRRGAERLRLGPWRGGGSGGEGRVALVAPGGPNPPGEALVREACAVLARRGYREALTGALAPPEQDGFLAAGFEVRDNLHLLAHDLRDVPVMPEIEPAQLRRGRRADRAAALTVDHAAFPPFWRLDDAGLVEAMTATPSARFRIATVEQRGRRHLVGYAVTGRAGDRGYLQRLAVHPGAGGRGIGRALVVDCLEWLRQRGAREVFVNTQTANDRALALYRGVGFRMQPTGLAVLGRDLRAGARP